MAAAEPDNIHRLVCPHCHKRFSSQLITGSRQRGFKCPHCRLFVPLDRAEESEPAAKRTGGT